MHLTSLPIEVPFRAAQQIYLRWLKTVSTTFQDIDFDGSLLPIFSN